MTRTLLFALGGLVLGGIIHIVVVLLVPGYAPADAWTRINDLTERERFTVLRYETGESDAVPMLDPLMRHAVCRFSIEAAPIRVRATIPGDFWSVALFNSGGENVYSINNDSVGSTSLDMLVLTVDQLAQLRENPPDDLDQMLIIESADDRGFVLLRAFVPDPSMEGSISVAMNEARCELQTGL
ncbi:MAG: hypothetical protein C0606_00440 [Hyphomicrobiales bacterium]|nr:MAG: hypothetical protein C0606_00440 [Hyphomicrobiales bacterium]